MEAGTMKRKSVLEDLGQEVTGITAPVTTCMALTVLLVRLLNPDGGNQGLVTIATAYYHEKGSDSEETKLFGSVVNALIFVVSITVMTFGLFLLFKYRCTSVINGYFAFAGFSIYFTFFGLLALQVLQIFQIPLDIITFTFLLYNFAVVGVLCTFFWPAPLTLKQGYLIITAVVVAYIFTHIPEWTTWTLLIAMALYDLYAVLTPGGPLKVLVELAMERGEELPALIYEGRPTQGPPGEPWRGRRHMRQRQQREGEEQDVSGGVMEAPAMPSSARADAAADGHVPSQTVLSPGVSDTSDSTGTELEETGEASALEQGSDSGMGREASTEGQLPTGPQDDSNPNDEEEGAYLPDGIKLGLGDFIFYSVLVGQAATYDLLTVFACYLAIMAGLGMTLLLLTLYHHILPALPVSIGLGVVFYFTSRIILEPFILPLSTSLLYF